MFKIKGIKLVLICLLVTLSASCFSLLFVNAYSSFAKPAEPQAAAVYDFANGAISTTTSYSEYTIGSLAALQNFETSVNDNNIYLNNKTIKLTQNINCNGDNISIKGVFSGTFDGQGYTISNVKQNTYGNTYSTQTAGFFKSNSGTIKNTKFSNFEINILTNDVAHGGSAHEAAVITAYNSGTIVSCIVNNPKFIHKNNPTKVSVACIAYKNTGSISNCIVDGEYSVQQGNKTGLEAFRTLYAYALTGPLTSGSVSSCIYNATFKKVEDNITFSKVEEDLALNKERYSCCYNSFDDVTGGAKKAFFSGDWMPDQNIWHNYKGGYSYSYGGKTYWTWLKAFINMKKISFSAVNGSIYPSGDYECPQACYSPVEEYNCVTIYGQKFVASSNDSAKYEFSEWIEDEYADRSGYSWTAIFEEIGQEEPEPEPDPEPEPEPEECWELEFIGNGSATESLPLGPYFINKNNNILNVSFNENACSFTFTENGKDTRTTFTYTAEGGYVSSYWINDTKYTDSTAIKITGNTKIKIGVTVVQVEPDPAWKLLFDCNDALQSPSGTSYYYVSQLKNNTVEIDYSTSVCKFTFTENGASSTTTVTFTAYSGYYIGVIVVFKSNTIIDTIGSDKTITITGDTQFSVVCQRKTVTMVFCKALEPGETTRVNLKTYTTDYSTIEEALENLSYDDTGNKLKYTFKDYNKETKTYEYPEVNGYYYEHNYETSGSSKIYIIPKLLISNNILMFANVEGTSNDAAESYSLKKDTVITISITPIAIEYSFKDSEDNNVLVTFNIINELYIFSSAGWENNAPITEDTTITPTVSQAYIYVRFNNATIGTHTAPPTGAVTKIDVGSLATPTGLNTNVLTFNPTLDGITKTVKYTTIKNAYIFTAAGIDKIDAEHIRVTPVLGLVLKQVTFAEIEKATEVATGRYTVKNNTAITVTLNAAKNVLAFKFNAFNKTTNTDETKEVTYTSHELYIFSSAGWENNAPITEDTTITPTVSQKYIYVQFNNATIGTHTVTPTGTVTKIDLNSLSAPTGLNTNVLTFSPTLDGVIKTVKYTTIANAYQFTAAGIVSVDAEHIQVTPVLNSTLKQVTFAEIEKATEVATGTYTVKNNTAITVTLNAAKNVLAFKFNAFNKTTNTDETKEVTYTSYELYIFSSAGWENNAPITEDTTITPVLEQAYILVTFGKTTGEAEISPNETNQIKVRYNSGDYISDGVIDWNACTLSYVVKLADGSSKTITYTINPREKYTFDTNNRTPNEPADTEIVTISPTLILKMYDVGFGEA